MSDTEQAVKTIMIDAASNYVGSVSGMYQGMIAPYLPALAESILDALEQNGYLVQAVPPAGGS